MHDHTTPRDLNEYLGYYNELPFERIAETFRRDEVLKIIERLRTKKLGEIGCGANSIFNSLDSSIGGFIVEPIAELLILQKSISSKVTTYCGQIEELETHKVEQVDTLLLSSILHEVENAEDFLDKALKTLEEGGYVVCVVPNSASIHRYVGWQKGILENISSQTETQKLMQQRQEVFSKETLPEFFKKMNVTEIETYSFMPKLLSHSQMQEILDKEVINFEFLRILNSISALLEPVGSELMYIGQKNERKN